MKRVRLYVNWLDDRRGMRWSVDEGTQATEQTVRSVKLHDVSGTVRVDMRARRDKGEPNAWVEFSPATVRVTRARVAHIETAVQWVPPVRRG